MTYATRNRQRQDERLNCPSAEPNPECNHGLRLSQHDSDMDSLKDIPCESDCDLGVIQCPMCDGNGGVTLPPARPFNREEWYECRRCRGTGKVMRG